jgi:hypothetical protein
MDLKYYETNLSDNAIMQRVAWCDENDIAHNVAVVESLDLTFRTFDICVQWTFFNQQDLMSFVITWHCVDAI